MIEVRRPGRRALLAAGVLALWIAGLGVLVHHQLFRPHTERLAEAGLRVTPGAEFYAVLQGGQQIGFASSTIDTTDGGITVTDYLVADLPVAGKLHRASARTSTQVTRALRVTHFTVDVDADLAPIKAAGTVLGDSLMLLAVGGVSGQPVDTQRIVLNGPVLLPTLVPLAIALGERPSVGSSYTLPVFDPMTMAPRDMKVSVVAESVFVLHDSSVVNAATKRWEGVLPDTVRAWRMTTTAEGKAGFDGWVDEQGRIVLVTRLLGLTLERRPYEVAFENWKADAAARGALVTADRDIYETTAITAKKKLRANLKELRVRLTGVDLDGFDVKGYRQQLRGDTLTITREDPTAMRAAYRLPDGARGTPMALFLGAEPLLETRSREIQSLARRLRGRDTDPRVVAQRINLWVYDSLAKKITIGVPSALATLRTRVGDCNEHAQLYVALARAAGIPARIAAGLAYLDGKFYYHAWPEVWLERWVAVDPTFGQFPADASHLRFTVGGLGRQAELLRLMGALQIDVLSAH
ncbi:MAG: transglutaminase family protein [Gemmatimonadales bacterium]